MRENYQLFGLDQTATDEELTARYQALKAKYNEDRWLDGEAGNEAALMLTKLDVAYGEIMAARRESKQGAGGKSAYEEISELLKADKLSEAQARLDDCNDRDAEWHYLQAVVFYKKNWSNDSKKQLEIAMQMDPNNAKYRTAYDKMNAKSNYQEQSAHEARQNPYANEPLPDDQMGGNACSDCMTCCYLNLCVNCLFNCCCGCR